jgi:hypothetical protein
MDITGSQWASMVNDTAEQSFETIEELWNEFGIIPRIMRSRLLTDARASVHAEGRFEELELISESERKTRAMAERLEFLTGDKSKSGKPKEFADETSEKSSTIKARIHFSPKIPAESVVENNEGIIDAIEALQLFGIGMSTWMEAHDPALAKAITEVMDRVTEAQMEGLIEKFSPATKKIDIELGGHLYSSSPNECQLELHDAQKRKHRGHTSGLKIIWQWMELVDEDSKTRMAFTMEKWQKRAPTEHAGDLYADVQSFKRELGTMTRLRLGNFSDGCFPKLVEQAMDRMLSKLTEDNTLLKPLMVPMSTVSAEPIQVQLVKLEKCAKEMRFFPKPQSQARESRWSKNRNRSGKGGHGASPAAAATPADM